MRLVLFAKKHIWIVSGDERKGDIRPLCGNICGETKVWRSVAMCGGRLRVDLFDLKCRNDSGIFITLHAVSEGNVKPKYV